MNVLTMSWRRPAKACLHACLVLMLSASATALAAADTETSMEDLDPTRAVSDIRSVLESTAYDFKSSGKQSPFTPFVRTPPSTIISDEVLEVTERLEGLQLFEPSQLTLTAILARSSGFTALIATPTGRGYVAKVGTKVGKRGTIAEISETALRIQEIYKMRSGDEVTKDLTMKLN